MEYSAIGLTVHLASRMEQLAPAGHTFLTAATLNLVEGYVQVISVGLVPVKGLGQPLEAFRLLGTSRAPPRIPAGAARGPTRGVGRQRELAPIDELLRIRQRKAHGRQRNVRKPRFIRHARQMPQKPGDSRRAAIEVWTHIPMHDPEVRLVVAGKVIAAPKHAPRYRLGVAHQSFRDCDCRREIR